MPEYKNWCFTSFNLDIQWEHMDIQSIDKKNAIKYIVYQGEYTKDMKKHIQGYIQMTTKKEMTYIKKLLGDKTIHLEPAKGTPSQSAEYCKKTEKDGAKQELFFNYIEYGILDETVSGTRTDLISIKKDIENGKSIFQIQREAEDTKTFETLLRYKRPLAEYARDIQREQNKETIKEYFTGYTFNRQQIAIKNIIDEELLHTNTRQINWIYDPIGGIGKTDLAKYYITHTDTYLITGGKQADILYAYKGEPLIIYDLARTYADNIEHIFTTIENLKNGVYLSTKYESEQRIYKVPTIVILANFLPDQSKLSQDRWNILHTEHI